MMTVALIKSFTDMVSPSFNQISEPPMEAACALAVTWSSKEILPESMASITNTKVITLVIEAHGRNSFAFFSYKILPVFGSIKIADGAATSSSEIADTGITNETAINTTTTTIAIALVFHLILILHLQNCAFTLVTIGMRS